MATHYDHITAKKFEKYAATEFGNKYPLDLEKFEKYFGEGKNVLEIGCGWGRLGRFLIKKYNYIGIDIHKPYLEYFRDYLNKNEFLYDKETIVDCSILNYSGKNFDIILFPWTVIGDIPMKDQILIFKRCKKMLNKNGVILLDNPAKETKYSEAKNYKPTKFYYENRKDKFSDFGFTKHDYIKYKTLTEKIREIVILKH